MMVKNVKANKFRREFGPENERNKNEFDENCKEREEKQRHHNRNLIKGLKV